MSPEEAAALVDALGDAFASGSVEAVTRLFVADGDCLYAGSEAGEVAVGRPALRLLLAGLFERPERYSWRSGSVQVVGCVAGFAVVAEATLFVDPWPAGAPGATRECVPYRVSGVVEAEPDGWRWRFCHGSEPAPPGTG